MCSAPESRWAQLGGPDGLQLGGPKRLSSSSHPFFLEEMRARNSLKLTRPCALPSHGGSLSLFLFFSLGSMRPTDDELLNCARRIINEDNVR